MRVLHSLAYVPVMRNMKPSTMSACIFKVNSGD